MLFVDFHWLLVGESEGSYLRRSCLRPKRHGNWYGSSSAPAGLHFLRHQKE